MSGGKVQVVPRPPIGLGRILLFIVAGIVLLFLIAPIFVVVPMSFSAANYLEFPPREWSLRWYEAYFSSSEWMMATRNSMTLAIATTLIATPVGAAAAYGIRFLPPLWSRLVYALLLSPQVMPVILVGIGVLFLYSVTGLVNSFVGILAAHVALAVPFVLVTMASGFKGFDQNQEDAARNLGASRLRAVIDVTLPQLKLSLLAGALFAFITSLDEVVIGLFIAGGDNMVLPRHMFLALRDQIDPTIAAISSLLILISTIVMAVFIFMQRRP